MFNRILVVCDGNICRSPYAAFLLDSLTKKEIRSAGLHAVKNSPADKTIRDIGVSKNIDLTGHVSRQISREMIDCADLILVMESRHISEITLLAPEARGKVMLLGKWRGEMEIEDPYRRSREVYELISGSIEECVNSWVDYL